MLVITASYLKGIVFTWYKKSNIYYWDDFIIPNQFFLKAILQIILEKLNKNRYFKIINNKLEKQLKIIQSSSSENFFRNIYQ